MRTMVKLCKTHGVAIGAHPSLPDLQGFGRREMQISQQEAYGLTLYQIGALQAFTQAEGVRLHHVKPHGALYNMAAKHPDIAEGIAQAVYDFDPTLILYALSNSTLAKVGEQLGLQVAHEVFADRTYQADGSLTPRSQPDSLITDVSLALQQVLTMLTQNHVHTLQGQRVPIKADTLCIHGDSIHALEFAKALRRALTHQGISIKAVDHSHA